MKMVEVRSLKDVLHVKRKRTRWSSCRGPRMYKTFLLGYGCSDVYWLIV